MTEEFQIGVITQTHGIKGELKVFPTTDDTGRFKKLKEVIADTGKKRLKLNVSGVKFFKQFVIIKFKEFDDINDVEFLKNAKLLVDREHAVRLAKNEYFVADLIGMKCISDLDEELGVITDVLSTVANDVYVISEGANELLVPAIKDCVLDVDFEKGQIRLHLLEGLR